MKKALVILSVLLAVAGCRMQAGKPAMPDDELGSVIGEFSEIDGFTVINLGRTGTSIARAGMKIASNFDDDDELKILLRLMDEIDAVTIVDFDDALSFDRKKFASRIEPLLPRSALITECVDDGDVVRIYGLNDRSSGAITDIVLYAPSEEVLIRVSGTVDSDALDYMNNAIRNSK